MAFTTFKYLLFFVVGALVYFIIPKKGQWIWLLLCSLFFYLCAGPKYIIYFLFTSLSTWLSALGIEKLDHKCRLSIKENKPDKEIRKAMKAKTQKQCQAIAAVCLLVNIGILAVLKYLNFAENLLSSFVASFGFTFTPTQYRFILPLGISFYTFQSAGYLIDVYRGMTKAQRNPAKLLLFLGFFPCLIQGPIGRYSDLAPQLYEGHRFSYDRVTSGTQRIAWGFFEKLVIADRLNILVNTVFTANESYNGAQLCLTMVLYAFQIYADFQGYMDIACGSAQVLGIEIAENFNSPYLSASVPEFWRRWHITLGSWFRDYLYYPVMRSYLFCKLRNLPKSKSSAKVMDRTLTVAALLVVWITTGLWHGASTTYLAWGAYHGILISLSTVCTPLFDKWVKKLRLDRSRPSYQLFQILKTFCIVCIGYVFFRAESLSQALTIVKTILTTTNPSTIFTLKMSSLGLDTQDCTVALVSIVLLIAVDILHARGIHLREKIAQQGLWLRWIIWLSLFSAVLILGIYGPGYDAASFIYFAF